MPLKLNGEEIHSIEELRKQFDVEEVAKYFLNGTLSQWLKDCFYDREYEKVSNIPKEKSVQTEFRLCTALGLNYVDVREMTDEERYIFEKKRQTVSTYITDGDVLSHIMETATNQVELVEVIEEGWDKIYLCGGPFSVPIHIKGKHYIGIGDPVINTPFTQEQYKRAGVTFEGVKLPEEPDQSMLATAEEAAEANGYTDWEDERGEFVELLHRGMECKRYDFAPALDIDDRLIEFRTYHSLEKAVEDARELVNRTYDQAIRMMTPGTEDCVAGPLAAYYGAVLRAAPMALARKLRPWDKRADRLCSMLQEGETRLREELEERLFKGSDYYHMYRRQYFIDHIRVTRLDAPAEVFESDFLNNILHFFAEDPDYTVGGVSENMVTLKNDFDSRMSTLCECAYERYVSYCKEIEKIAGEIEADLTDDGWKNDIQG